MAFNPGDLSINIVPSDSKNIGNGCVVGREFSFKINFRNLSLTDPMYNLFLRLTLPDGISFVSSSLIPTTNNIVSNQNIVTFVNIKDLYPNETNFQTQITIKVDNTYRATNALVPYNLNLGLSIYAKIDSKPRGNIDANNTTTTTTTNLTVKSLRYYAKIVYPPTYLKGGGTTSGPIIDATSIFNISIELTNSIRESSIVSLLLNLANGLRYIGQWSSSGTDSYNFNNPIITTVNQTQDHVSIALNNKTLSSNSSTTLTFQIAIWNNYTANGLENSGSLIENNSELESSLLISGNDTLLESFFAITTKDLIITLSTETLTTDVSTLNEYTLNYSVTEYLALSNVVLTFTIPDGMEYSLNSSTVTPTTITTINYKTILTWNMISLLSNTDGEIKLYTITSDRYSSNNESIYSTDTFTTTFEASYLSIDNITTITDSTSVTLTVISPILTTEVEGYYYNNLDAKDYNVAALEDYVKFSITYDASYLIASQKDVALFDYPPLNILASGVINIEATGDIPAGTTYYPVPDNGAMIPLGTLDGGTYFKISFYLPVTEGIIDSIFYNLAKANFINSSNESTSIRDSSLVYFGIPHLKINQSRSTTNCLSLDDTFNYEILIENNSDANTNYIVDSFNINLNATIPSLFEILSPPEITGISTHTNLSVSNNEYNLTITTIPPNSFLKITTPVKVSTIPIMGNDYTFSSNITNGTSQPLLTSTPYTYNEFPLNNALILTGCVPTISKSYTPSTVNLYQEYTTTITVTFPQGGLAYNTKIKDSIISTDSTYFNSLSLNGDTVDYTLTTNNLTVPISPTLDTTNGPLTYVLTYKNTSTTATPINYEDNKSTISSIDWSDVYSSPEIYNESILSTLKIIVPYISASKYQSNVSKSLTYDKNPVYFSSGDLINYKISLSNLGKSTAFNIDFSDILPANFIYISNNIGGTYSSSNGEFLATIESIDSLDTIDIIIEGSINNTPYWVSSNNSSTASYKANLNAPSIYGNSSSNVITSYNLSNIAIIEKQQRNLTTNGNFTKSTVKCFYEQSIEYKIDIYNPFNETMTNVQITDTFPEQLTFISHSTFNEGTIDVNNNVITTTISSISAGTHLSYTYIITLNEIALNLESSFAIIDYAFENSLNSFTVNSNILYLKLLHLGKGFLVY